MGSSVVDFLRTNLSLYKAELHACSLQLREDFTTTGSADPPPRLRKATVADIEEARVLVSSALSEAATCNKARLDNPARNRYTVKPGTPNLQWREFWHLYMCFSPAS